MSSTSGAPAFNASQWAAINAATSSQMLAHVAKFMAPISKALAEDHGVHHGTGSFCEFGGKKFILTNEHVAREQATVQLAYTQHGSEAVLKILKSFYSLGPPVDVAVSHIEDAIWHTHSKGAQPIPSSRFGLQHAPADGELLFLAGYSGERSVFGYDQLNSRGTPYLTQECSYTGDGFDPAYHFAIHYNPAGATRIDGKSGGLPKPDGLSGSLVWNTRVVEMLTSGQPWTPDAAYVTGIVWGWPTDSACLVATKVEQMQLATLSQHAAQDLPSC